MKATFLVPKTGPHPLFNRAAARAAKRAGQAYNVPAEIHYRPGDEIEIGSVEEAQVLCCSVPPVCSPADEACAGVVWAFFNNPLRRKRLAQLKRMATKAVYDTLPPELQKYVDMATGKYAEELQTVTESGGGDDDETGVSLIGDFNAMNN